MYDQRATKIGTSKLHAHETYSIYLQNVTCVFDAMVSVMAVDRPWTMNAARP